MKNSFDILLCLGVLIAACVTFGAYRWSQIQRTTRIKGWIRDFLCGRYGMLPEPLVIHCTDDRRWPVLVQFDRPSPATRHRLQFMCGGLPSSLTLIAEIEERRAAAR
ncbi:MAG: hypothetical protein ACKV0T_27175 [Planctomycetales bacterium]